MISSVALTVILTRTLSTEDYASYSYALSFATIALLPILGGIPVLVLRETARGLSGESLDEIIGVWLWAIAIILTFGLVLISITELSSNYVGTLESRLPKSLNLAILYSTSMSLLWATGAAIRGFNKIFLGGLSAELVRPVLFSIALLLISLFEIHRIDAAFALKIHIATSLVALAASAVIIAKFRIINLKNLIHAKYRLKYWNSSLLPLSFSAGISVIMANTDLVMMGFLGKNAEVGIYNVATRTATWAAFGLLIVNQATQPRIATLFHENKNKELQSLVGKASKYAFASALLAALFIFLWGAQLLKILFGETYQAAYAPLLIITFGQLGNSFFGPVRSLLDLSGHEKIVLRIMFMMAMLNIIMNAILIPSFGGVGAATATTISLFGWNFFCWRSAKVNCFVDTRAINLELLRKPI
ncbi:hypothetical protein B6V74_18495 [Thioclava sp. F42-5]|nr:hypothetical protein B6V74_18495 [Thioclava sp. F42-5]